MKVLVADDHELFRDGLRHVLRQLDLTVTVLSASDFVEAIAAAEREVDIDVVLLDLLMPGGPWEAGLERLRQVLPERTRIVVVSAADDRRHVSQAMALGAAGFIPKTASSRVMLSAIHLVLSGGTYLPAAMLSGEAQDDSGQVMPGGHLLTPRQQEVLTLLRSGKSNKEMARDLNLAEGTVKLHVTAILKALNVTNRTRAVVAAAELGLAGQSA